MKEALDPTVAIHISDISKSYGKIKALDGVTLDVNKGEIFGLIGADGSGKTTLFEIMVTLISPDGGIGMVEGLDVRTESRRIRSRIGYMPGKFSLYQDLSVEENLQFFASIFGTTIESGYNLIAPIWNQLLPFKTRSAGKLSGGMKQKLALCCALVHQPTTLFLDEPTTGVDPVSRVEFWEMLYSLRDKGIAIMVSTPYMDEARKCSRIAFIQQGKLLGIDTPTGFISSYRNSIYSIRVSNPYELMSHLRSECETCSCFAFGDSVHWSVGRDNTSLVDKMVARGLFGADQIKKIDPGIEDCFIELMAKTDE